MNEEGFPVIVGCVKGVWARISGMDPFCIEFAQDPSMVAEGCDVVVCTSVIRVGFSINIHFQSCHAFL